ncbi:hypothetical protein QQP08_020263 [Theobroma cacao]|nr:hypothetical protein QQP08_020263 [Theobroma cacao]
MQREESNRMSRVKAQCSCNSLESGIIFGEEAGGRGYKSSPRPITAADITSLEKRPWKWEGLTNAFSDHKSVHILPL